MFGAPIALRPAVTGQDFYLWKTPSFTARLALDTVDRINAALADPKRSSDEEQGGILLGRALAANVVEVTGFEFVRSEHRHGIAYDLGARERERVTNYVERLRRRKGTMPIGYFRTHRRPGLFLDQDDFSLMTDAFAQSSSAALVIKPSLSGPPTAGFFFWRDGDMDRARTQLTFAFDGPALLAQGMAVTVPHSELRSARLTTPAWQAMGLAALAAVTRFVLVSASPRPSGRQTRGISVAALGVTVEPARSTPVSDEQLQSSGKLALRV
jgi:hypothetical protein